MGNMYTRRPDLFAAVHCLVPLLDMKTYHTLLGAIELLLCRFYEAFILPLLLRFCLAGASWVAEYGDPENPEVFLISAMQYSKR
jgi:prolyl oligopeptidase